MFHTHLRSSIKPSTSVVVLKCTNYGRFSQDSDSLRAGRSGDRTPVRARFSAPVRTDPGAHPASCIMGTRSLTPGTAPGAWRWPPYPCRAKVKERVQVQLYYSSGPSWSVLFELHSRLFSNKTRETETRRQTREAAAVDCGGTQLTAANFFHPSCWMVTCNEWTAYTVGF